MLAWRLSIVIAVAIAGCASDGAGGIVLPVADAERARELKLLAMPAVTQLTRDEFGALAEKKALEETDEHVRTRRDAYGRLGYFARDFDLRGSARDASAFYGAFYYAKTKGITVVEGPPADLLVHELTHALQDQHFDLERLYKPAMSSDEALAKRGLIEGDAVLAQLRYQLWKDGREPTSEIGEYVNLASARQASEQTLIQSSLPLIFSASPAFSYTFGPVYVAKLLHVEQGAWSYREVNALLAAEGPRSTQEVLRAGGEVDAIEPVGFGALPAIVSADYDVETVDRMGEWYTYLLLYPSVSVLPPSTRTTTRPALSLEQLTAAWDGDQLLLLRNKKDGASGIVWTSIWDDEDAATELAASLVRLHGAKRLPDSGAHAFVARDGEPIWLEQRGTQVCFVKNLPSTMELLAEVALSTREEKRLAILRSFAVTPIVH
jgi:hypothetical protein